MKHKKTERKLICHGNTSSYNCLVSIVSLQDIVMEYATSVNNKPVSKCLHCRQRSIDPPVGNYSELHASILHNTMIFGGPMLDVANATQTL